MSMIINELSVAQGFGSIQKVFNMKAGEAINYGMVCELSADGLKKGYSGVGMAYVAQNDCGNTDAKAVAADYTFIGDGTNTQIVAIPVTAPCEIELPSARFVSDPDAGDELVAATAGNVGKWEVYVDGAGGVVIGTVTEVTADGFLVLLEKTVRAAVVAS